MTLYIGQKFRYYQYHFPFRILIWYLLIELLLRKHQITPLCKSSCPKILPQTFIFVVYRSPSLLYCKEPLALPLTHYSAAAVMTVDPLFTTAVNPLLVARSKSGYQGCELKARVTMATDLDLAQLWLQIIELGCCSHSRS